jgi:hypothetical protein
MENIEFKQDGNILTIKVDVSKRLRKSTSGKITIVASTNGNTAVAVDGGQSIIAGINIYTK